MEHSFLYVLAVGLLMIGTITNGTRINEHSLMEHSFLYDVATKKEVQVSM